jgi:KaiC/GvpD/RAD55 family RecA-like ATPase
MTYEVKRCPTGIPGLDEILDGGFPRGRTILLKGACGTGKSILGVQFLHQGIVRYNEPGVLVLLEQNIQHLKSDMLMFGCDMSELEDLGKLIVIDASLSRFNLSDINLPRPPHDKSFSLTSLELIETKEVIDIVVDTAEEINAKRVVIDSLPALDNLVKSKGNTRDIILGINYRLQAAELTSILISDILENRKGGVEEYVVDGVVLLEYKTTGPDIGRYLTIEKMRATKHSENIHPIRFKEGVGLEVLGVEEM